MLSNARVPVLGFAAYSGTGKTTLLEKLLPLLRDKGLRIGVIKHAHHDFDIDHPGKDSYRLRKAGATQMLVASHKRWALVVETDDAKPEPDLDDLIQKLDQNILDLILVEGFKHEAFSRIELHRPALGKPLMCPNDPYIVAVASDAPIVKSVDIPILDINEPGDIADFVIARCIHKTG